MFVLSSPPELQNDFIVTTRKATDGESEIKIIRLFVSFDCAWGQRGNGYKYDSLNGFCTMIGYKTDKVLDFCTKNRKCKTCDINRKLGVKKEHDCRLNHHGTARAMEAEGAVQLMAKSEILKEADAEVGVFIGDNDSSALSALEEVLGHPIIKQCDINHSKKGVSKMLYKIRENKSIDLEGELTHDAISYLKDSFAIAVKKNKNNKAGMEKDIRNLPDHVFDKHENCGSFCKFDKEKDDYDNSRHMKNPVLYQHVKKLFSDLANNAGKFVLAASSNTNESINNSMASYCPKSHSYSTTESADFRFACTVAHKNLGKDYILRVLEKMNLSYSKKLVYYCNSAKKKAIKRLQRETDPRTKALRKLNGLKKQQLKNRKEKASKDTYCSDMTLLEIPLDTQNIIREIDNDLTYNTKNLTFVFFDLETGGFSRQKDILQIALKSEKKIMSVYLTPSKNIDAQASEVTGLTKNGRQLFLHGELVPTLVPKKAAAQVIEYLESFGTKVILIAHNCDFDSDRIVSLYKRLCMIEPFERVVQGFVDTLSLFRKKFPERKSHKLGDLAKDFLEVSTDNAHNAIFDIDILEKLATKYLSWEDLSKNQFSVQDVMNKIQMAIDEKLYSRTCAPMSSAFSKILIKNLSRNKVDYFVLLDKFIEGDVSLEKFLIGGETPLVKSKKTVNNILDFFSNLKNVIENGMPNSSENF